MILNRGLWCRVLWEIAHKSSWIEELASRAV